MMGRRKPKLETRYEISVWDNMRGDLVKKAWEATESEREEIYDNYGDEPGIEIVIDREWEEEVE